VIASSRGNGRGRIWGFLAPLVSSAWQRLRHVRGRTEPSSSRRSSRRKPAVDSQRFQSVEQLRSAGLQRIREASELVELKATNEEAEGYSDADPDRDLRMLSEAGVNDQHPLDSLRRPRVLIDCPLVFGKSPCAGGTRDKGVAEGEGPRRDRGLPSALHISGDLWEASSVTDQVVSGSLGRWTLRRTGPTSRSTPTSCTNSA
jgi:hypothetical protein